MVSVSFKVVIKHTIMRKKTHHKLLLDDIEIAMTYAAFQELINIDTISNSSLGDDFKDSPHNSLAIVCSTIASQQYLESMR